MSDGLFRALVGFGAVVWTVNWVSEGFGFGVGFAAAAGYVGWFLTLLDRP